MASGRPVKSNLVSLNHTKEMHMKAISALCRLCYKRSMRKCEIRKKGMGRKQNSIKLPVSNAKTSKLIKDFCGFDTTDDVIGKHPPNICRSCYNILHRKTKEPYSDFIAKSNELNLKWKPYEEGSVLTSCFPCTLYAGHSVAGAPVKKHKLNKKTPCEYCKEELSQKQACNHVCYDEKLLSESVSEKTDYALTPPKQLLASIHCSGVSETITSYRTRAHTDTPTSKSVPGTCVSARIPNEPRSVICDFCHTDLTNYTLQS